MDEFSTVLVYTQIIFIKIISFMIQLPNFFFFWCGSINDFGYIKENKNKKYLFVAQFAEGASELNEKIDRTGRT